MCRQGVHEDVAEEQMADRIFEQAYIPRRLEEVQEYERDHDRLAGELPLCYCLYHQKCMFSGVGCTVGACLSVLTSQDCIVAMHDCNLHIKHVRYDNTRRLLSQKQAAILWHFEQHWRSMLLPAILKDSVCFQVVKSRKESITKALLA